MLLIALLESYALERPDIAPCSLRYLGYSINNFRRFLCREPSLADLNKQTILAWMAWAAKTISPRSINHHRVNLISLWNHAADLDMIYPPPRIPKRKEPRREPVVFTLEEMKRIWDATDLLEGNWSGMPIRMAWKVALAILWDTAVRIGTLLKAELREVNLELGTWHVPAEHLKGGRADRVYRLHRCTIELVIDAYKYQRRMLFPFPFRKEAAERHFGKILELAGVPSGPKRKFHCIRRTAESYAAANMGIEAAAAAVGHSVQIAARHYVSAAVCQPPSLIDGLPRPF